MEVIFFSLEILLIAAGCLLLFASVWLFGGLERNGAAVLAGGLYALANGVGVVLLPQMLWEVARTDNAFLGLFAFGLILVPAGLVLILVGGIGTWRRERLWRSGGPAMVIGVVGIAMSLGLLAARGPEPWQTRIVDAPGAGTFGFYIILAGLIVGGAVFFTARALRRPIAD